MRLYIDNSNNQKTIVGLDDIRLEKITGLDKSQQVLGLINQILKEHKKTLKDITEIKIEIGPGSFTGLKVGVAIANTLGWVLKISVNKQKPGKLIEPKYQ